MLLWQFSQMDWRIWVNDGVGLPDCGNSGYMVQQHRMQALHAGSTISRLSQAPVTSHMTITGCSWPAIQLVISFTLLCEAPDPP